MTTVEDLQTPALVVDRAAFDRNVATMSTLRPGPKFVLGRVVSVDAERRWAVADIGLKALGMDHGDPAQPGASIWFCSDEHVTFEQPDVPVGDLVRVLPAHVDPTVAKHESLWVVDGDQVIDEWPVDLRGC